MSNIDLCCILGDKHKETEDRIASASSNTERVSVIENMLRNQILSIKNHEIDILAEIIPVINKLHGLVQIEKIADIACMSHRSLERLFINRVGLSPKQYLKIERMKFAISLMLSRQDKKLTDIALMSGFFDQAHFNNEFKSILQLTPREFMKYQC